MDAGWFFDSVQWMVWSNDATPSILNLIFPSSTQHPLLYYTIFPAYVHFLISTSYLQVIYRLSTGYLQF